MIRIMRQKPHYRDHDTQRAKSINVDPAVDVNGNASVYLNGDKLRLFLTAAEAVRIANDIVDSLAETRRATSTIHTTRTIERTP